jgi:CRP/FNR family transcriptional regulator, cyclic AMP receptor protein
MPAGDDQPPPSYPVDPRASRIAQDTSGLRWHDGSGCKQGTGIVAPILDPHLILQKLSSWPIEAYQAGETVLARGTATGKLLVMIEGVVEVVRDGTRIAEIAESGAVFGELALLLDRPHTADVRTLAPSTFHVADGRAILRVDPSTTLYVAAVLAQRLAAVNRYLVEVRPRMPQADQPRRLFEETLDNIGRSLRYGPPL